MTTIYGVYFICCFRNYLEIVEEQLKLLYESGLYNETYKLLIFICLYDKNNNELNSILKKYDPENKFELITTEENLYEKFAINNYKKYIREDNYYLYYFHTKGLKNLDDPGFNIIKSRRQILNFYIIQKYKICIKLLKMYDAVGCSLSLYPKKHFSGNFWWSKSEYLNTLENINNGYLSPEMYVLSNDNCKSVSLSQQSNNHLIENYKFRNDEKILNEITNQYIVVENHKKLIDMC